MRFLARLLLNGLAIVVAAYLVPGLRLEGPGAAVLAGVFLGFVNAIIRPVLVVLTLPLTLITLGLFIFVINTVCLSLTAYVIPGFSIDSFGAAFLGSLLVSLVSWSLSSLLAGKTEQRTD